MTDNVVTIAKRVEISNAGFLQGIFGDKWQQAHVTGFKEDPYDLDNLGLRHYWGGGPAKTKLKYCTQDNNTYFVISLFKEGEDGKARRRKDLHEATYVIVIDDVHDKVPAENIKDLPEPSYILETSSGNEQWGYILETPETRQERVDALLNGLVAAGIADDMKDPGMKGVTRYVRMPIGSNTKKKYGTPFKCKLTKWEPDTKYLLEDLARPFSIDVTNVSPQVTKYDAGIDQDKDPIIPLLQQLGLYKGKLKPDTYDIECPWVHEHTGAADSGSAYLSPFGFRCHHGSHEKKHFGDLMSYIDAQIPGAQKAVEWAQMVHEFDEDNRWPYEIAQTWKTKEDIEQHGAWLPHLRKLDPIQYDDLVTKWDVICSVPESVIQDIEDDAKTERENKETGGLKITRPSEWAGKTPPAREWVVEDWLPKGKVTSLYGDGGLGKTLVAQMLATSLSQGLPWLGEKTQKSKVLCVLCEDDEDEIWRRQDDINAAHMLDMKSWDEPDKDNLAYMCREGKDNLLMKFDTSGIGVLTDFWVKLRDAAVAMGAEVVIIDTLADVFGGNEVSRLEVRQFVQRALLGLAQDIDGSVLFLAHPSQAGKASGAGFSGSTAWNNSVRSRWYLSAMDDDDPGMPAGGRGNLRRLSRVKSNYSASGSETDKILEWEKGSFKVARSVSAGEINPVTGKTEDESKLEEIIQDGVYLANDKKYIVSLSPNVGRGTDKYLPVWCKRKVHSAGVYSVEEIERMVGVMEARGELVMEKKDWYAKGRRQRATSVGYIDGGVGSPMDVIDPFS